MHFVGAAISSIHLVGNKKQSMNQMIAILCLFLKRMRGLATFSLFHILFGANFLLSIGKTNVWIQIRSTAGGC